MKRLILLLFASLLLIACGSDSENSEVNEEEEDEEEIGAFESDRVEAMKGFHEEIIPVLDSLSANIEGISPAEFANQDMPETDEIVREMEEVNDRYKEDTGYNMRADMTGDERIADNEKVIMVDGEETKADDLIHAYSDVVIVIEDFIEDYNTIKEEYTEENYDWLETTYMELLEVRLIFENRINKM